MGSSCSACARDPNQETFSIRESGYETQVRSVRRMGWKRDLPDPRDRWLSIPSERLRDVVPAADLRRAEAFPIYDQGSLGSCTANAIAASFEFCQIREGLRPFMPSRLFIYYNERAMEGNTDNDAGAYIRDGIKSLHKIGVCDEAMWPYDESTFTEKPASHCYAAACKNKVVEYARVSQSLPDLKACIAAGYPFVFGFTLYSSFQCCYVAMTGKMSMPTSCDQMMGGHAVQAVGYDDARQVFIIRNSWGPGWGDHGYFYMPYEYITNPDLAADFWTIRHETGEARGVKMPTMGFGLGKCGGPTLGTTRRMTSFFH